MKRPNNKRFKLKKANKNKRRKVRKSRNRKK